MSCQDIQDAGPPGRPSKRRRLCFRLLAVLLSLALGLVVAEFAVSRRQRVIERSDRLDPGLVGHDPVLGWRLTPNWSGRHRHHDFDVHYSVNNLGFRADTPGALPSDAAVTWVLGDSFTFGLGVNDAETFVSGLNASAGPGQRFVNLAVPGYSTDQELLLLEEQLTNRQPQAMLLVVCLVNDLFDNELDMPLQVNAPKPRFEKGPTGLELRNVPVLKPTGLPLPGRPTLSEVVLGPRQPGDWARLLEDRSELFSVVRQSLFPDTRSMTGFQARSASAVDLFAAILDRMQSECRERRIELEIALLAGRSFVQEPRSVSALYQDALRRRVAALCQVRGLKVIDLGEALRAKPAGERRKLFHPHDGHLTPAGHVAVASLILSASKTSP